MDITTQRRAMNAATIGLIVAAGGVGYWSVSDLGESAVSDSRREIATPTTILESGGDSETESKVTLRALRGPLYDAPPAPKVVTAPTPPQPVVPRPTMVANLNLKLVGTIIDARQSVAIVSDSAGTFDVKASGETLELTPQGVTIQSIESEQVTLSYQGRESTIQLDRGLSASAPGAPMRPPTRGRNR